jgi:diaminopimelate epimerase
MVAAAAVTDGTAVRGTPFYKMSGSGNDFVMLDGRSTTPDQWGPAQIKAICDRRKGVGADGLVLLTPATPGAVRMRYWNSDGSPGALCGNAALCGGRLAVQLELVPAGKFCLLTDAGVVRVNSSASGEQAEINVPDFDVPGKFSGVGLERDERWMTLLQVGVPHLVIRVDDIEAVDVNRRGRALRFDPTMGPAGANVNFASPGAAPEDPWLIRPYERGVEAETPACGTGTDAAAASLVAQGEAAFPVRFLSRGGPELCVRGTLIASRAIGVWLGGQGRLVYRGVWEGS